MNLGSHLWRFYFGLWISVVKCDDLILDSEFHFHCIALPSRISKKASLGFDPIQFCTRCPGLVCLAGQPPTGSQGQLKWRVTDFLVNAFLEQSWRFGECVDFVILRAVKRFESFFVEMRGFCHPTGCDDRQIYFLERSDDFGNVWIRSPYGLWHLSNHFGKIVMIEDR